MNAENLSPHGHRLLNRRRFLPQTGGLMGGASTVNDFAFGSKRDPDGNIWVALGLSGSFESHNLFRGWAVKVTPQGKMIPICSGLRSPGGVGANAEGAMLAIESQGPWNGCRSGGPTGRLQPAAYGLPMSESLAR